MTSVNGARIAETPQRRRVISGQKVGPLWSHNKLKCRRDKTRSVYVRNIDFCHPASCLELQNRISVCISDVAAWMRSNRLQLNADKTEIVWCTSSRRQHQIPTASFAIGADWRWNSWMMMIMI